MNNLKDYSFYLQEGRPLSLQINDLASLFAGAKKVVYTSVKNEDDNLKIKKICKVFSFKIKILREFKDIDQSKTLDLLIGTDKKMMDRAAYLYMNGRPANWGEALDYPVCCVKNYMDWEKNKKGSLIERIFLNTKKNKAIDFRMNNLFNFYSRITSQSLLLQYKKFKQDNKVEMGFDIEPIIPWHPCSYDCAKSMKKSVKIYDFIFKCLPDMATQRKKLLSKPVFFKDDFDWIALDGEIVRKNKEIALRNFKAGKPFSLANEKDIKIVDSADKFETAKNKLSAKGFVYIPFN